MTKRTKRLARRISAALIRVLSPVLGWLIDHGVNLIAFIALGLLIATTIIGSMASPPFTLEPEKRPFLYDLSLAILGAWVFQQFLIALPARRKLRQYFMVFRPQLFTIAESGRQLLRDFEFISRCPHLPATSEHISRVLMATNLNSATAKLFRNKMADTREAVEELASSAQYLNEDIQHAIQVLRQNRLVRNARSDQNWRITLEEARKEKLLPYDPDSDTEKDYIRENWHGYDRDFTAYYQATQVIARKSARVRLPSK